MSSNQLILLLDIYRGFSERCHCGTLKNDLRLLMRKKLIVAVDTGIFSYRCTEEGSDLVQTLLMLGDKMW